ERQLGSRLCVLDGPVLVGCRRRLCRDFERAGDNKHACEEPLGLTATIQKMHAFGKENSSERFVSMTLLRGKQKGRVFSSAGWVGHICVEINSKSSTREDDGRNAVSLHVANYGDRFGTEETRMPSVKLPMHISVFIGVEDFCFLEHR